MKSLLQIAFVYFAIVVPVFGQQVCPPGGCPLPGFQSPIYFQPSPPALVAQNPCEVSAIEWFKKLVPANGLDSEANRAEAKKYINRAVRTRNNSGCGTSSLVGRSADAIYLLTNAHVATNRPGAKVTCEAVLADLSGTESFQGVVIEGAYSSTQTTDWALVKADGQHMRGIEPIKLSIKMPDTTKPAFTWGCPRCEVPQGQVLKTVAVDGAVWKWLPNSIGGQSGSAVIQRGYQHGLLTWSYGGQGGSVGAGQFTANIYKQSRNQTADSDIRPPGLLIPTGQGTQDDLVEGYFCSNTSERFAEIGNFQDPDQAQHLVDNGFVIDGFVRQSGVGDYPIWGDPDAPTDPVDPVDPVDPTDPTPPNKWALLDYHSSGVYELNNGPKRLFIVGPHKDLLEFKMEYDRAQTDEESKK